MGWVVVRVGGDYSAAVDDVPSSLYMLERVLRAYSMSDTSKILFEGKVGRGRTSLLVDAAPPRMKTIDHISRICWWRKTRYVVDDNERAN